MFSFKVASLQLHMFLNCYNTEWESRQILWFYEHIQFCLIRQIQYVIWEQTIKVHFPGLLDYHCKKKKKKWKSKYKWNHAAISNNSKLLYGLDGPIFSLEKF